MSDLESLNESIQSLMENIRHLETGNEINWRDIDRCLKALEGKDYENGENEEPNQFSALQGKHGLMGIPAKPEGETPISIQSRDLKWEYEALRDSVSRIKLPPKFHMNDSKAGISAKDRKQAAVLV